MNPTWTVPQIMNLSLPYEPNGVLTLESFEPLHSAGFRRCAEGPCRSSSDISGSKIWLRPCRLRTLATARVTPYFGLNEPMGMTACSSRKIASAMRAVPILSSDVPTPRPASSPTALAWGQRISAPPGATAPTRHYAAWPLLSAPVQQNFQLELTSAPPGATAPTRYTRVATLAKREIVVTKVAGLTAVGTKQQQGQCYGLKQILPPGAAYR